MSQQEQIVVFQQNLETTIPMACPRDLLCGLVRVDLDVSEANPDGAHSADINTVCDGGCELGPDTLRAAIRLASELSIAAHRMTWLEFDDGAS